MTKQSAPCLHSPLEPIVGREPTRAEECAASVEADALLRMLRPAVVSMILGRPDFTRVDHVSPAGLLQVVVTRTMLPPTKVGT